MEFIEIDGSLGEGGGQIVRTSMSLSTIYGEPIRIKNIRSRRKQRGLRPQHLQSVLASARLCKGTLDGAFVGSTEIEFKPGRILNSFDEDIDTGTAGSICLIAQTIIPISIFGKVDLNLRIMGGTEVPNSPTVDYLVKVVLPVYQKLGAKIRMEVEQRGYYPRGGGILKLSCSGTDRNEPLVFDDVDKSAESGKQAGIISCSRNLPSHVSQRQLDVAKADLVAAGFSSLSSSLDNEGRSFSPGSSILVHSKSESILIGSSSLGERGKPAEKVGAEAVQNYLNEIAGCANVDSHLADMLMTLLGCVNGKSVFTTSFLSDHFATNALVAKMITRCSIDHRRAGSSSWMVEVTGLRGPIRKA
ncbi:MAG: RNA 3'-terminal phosphate cyclase [Nitrososphaerales archaeon]